MSNKHPVCETSEEQEEKHDTTYEIQLMKQAVSLQIKEINTTKNKVK